MFLKKNKFFFSILVLCLFLPITVLKVQAQYNHNDNHNQEQNNHPHKTLNISNNSVIPTINIEVYPDKMKGWNLEIKTTNFTFNPKNVNQDSSPNNGHAHLYINGKKVTRIYSNWHYISDLSKGENEIKVTLNTNLHEELIYHNNVIGDRVIIYNEK
ncbi:MAG: hypothetical protein FWJ34_09780 [Geminocystis sp. GBBB08]|nr:hypothetical protein [Geminocystis sp. GBBB08]